LNAQPLHRTRRGHETGVLAIREECIFGDGRENRFEGALSRWADWAHRRRELIRDRPAQRLQVPR
jgi:hypothetical protein